MRLGANTLVKTTSSDGPRIRRFSDEAVVFNPLSGDTHLLAGPMVAVLEAIAAGEKTYPDVWRVFRTHSDTDLPVAELEAYLEQALSELAALDLIDIVSV